MFRESRVGLSPLPFFSEVPKYLKTRMVRLWHSLLGQDMTGRLGRLVIPNLVWNQEIYGELLLRSVSHKTRWLDAGCGHRVLPADFEEIAQAAVSRTRLAVGVDLDLDALRRHSSFRFTVCSSLDCLPFSAESFDLVTCNMVAEHLPIPEAAFREFERVLVPGGFLVIHTPNLLSYVVTLARMARTLLPRRAYLALVRLSEAREEEDVFPAFYRANTRRRLRSLLESHGFLEAECRMLIAPQPICNFFAPIGFLELLCMRATMFRPLRSLASTILATYQKRSPPMKQPAAPEPSCSIKVADLCVPKPARVLPGVLPEVKQE